MGEEAVKPHRTIPGFKPMGKHNLNAAHHSRPKTNHPVSPQNHEKLMSLSKVTKSGVVCYLAVETETLKWETAIIKA